MSPRRRHSRAQARAGTYGIALAPLAAMTEDERREVARGHVVAGALWFLGGIAVTVGTYAAAADGGTYVVAWGAIAYGAIRLVRGSLAASTSEPVAPPTARVVVDDPSEDVVEQSPPRLGAVLVVTVIAMIALALAVGSRPARRDAYRMPENITLPDDLTVIDIPNPDGSGTIPSLGRAPRR